MSWKMEGAGERQAENLRNGRGGGGVRQRRLGGDKAERGREREREGGGGEGERREREGGEEGGVSRVGQRGARDSQDDIVRSEGQTMEQQLLCARSCPVYC